LAYGNILNFSRHFSIYSDTSGKFILDVYPGDTLVLSAVGYFYRKVVATDTLLKSNPPSRFFMAPRTYEISEARIVRLGTYDEFRQNFISLDKPRTQTEVLADDLAEISHKVAGESYYHAQAEQKLDGIRLLTVPILTPEEKERLELARILEEEEIRNQIYRKFNPEVVRKVTGMKEDDNIIEFMIFCDFSDNYLLIISEYELMEDIAMKFGAFKRKRHRTFSGEQPVNLNQDTYNPHAPIHA
jgi:hypothetical protein